MFNFIRRRVRRLLILTALTLVLGLAPVQAAGPYDLSWHCIDSGGGTSVAGFYRLFSAIGQAEAGRRSGGSYVLEDGFLNGAIDAANAAQLWFLYE